MAAKSSQALFAAVKLKKELLMTFLLDAFRSYLCYIELCCCELVCRMYLLLIDKTWGVELVY
jgi:hypothetical protein